MIYLVSCYTSERLMKGLLWGLKKPTLHANWLLYTLKHLDFCRSLFYHGQSTFIAGRANIWFPQTKAINLFDRSNNGIEVTDAPPLRWLRTNQYFMRSKPPLMVLQIYSLLLADKTMFAKTWPQRFIKTFTRKQTHALWLSFTFEAPSCHLEMIHSQTNYTLR